MENMMLIVDDDKSGQVLLRSAFSGEFAVKTADSVRTALYQLNYYGIRISVVLLSLGLPGTDGFELLSEMSENTELMSIPVIAISSGEDNTIGLRAIEAGAADFVFKPLDLELLKIRVSAAIKRGKNARRRAENFYYLRHSGETAKYRTVLDSTGTVVIEIDRADGSHRYDPSISKHIAGTYDDRKLWRILMSDRVADVSDVKAMQELVYKVSYESGENGSRMTVRLKTPSGDMQWFRLQVFVRPDQSKGAGKTILTIINVNDEIVNSGKLRYHAERDSLTGLYSRAAFFEKAKEMIAAHKPGYYVMGCFDINKFKVINDQQGTEKGDELLKSVAREFERGFSSMGGICSRIMADDFAALYPSSYIGTDALSEIYRKATEPEDGMQPISFSVGRYLIDDLSLPVSGMYDRALLAQSAAKGSFSNYIATYDESMREQLLKEQRVTSDMKEALEAEQFEVWFQPQYNHSTRALIGSEALVRWRHPTLGLLVPPGDFIPVFERNGFIYEMDKYVWEKTCKHLRRWLDEGCAPLPVSVNISRYDLLQEDFFSALTGLVEKYALPVDMLRVEITETAFMDSPSLIVRIVKSLINYGFTVEIDDFGSGYSSLNTLKDVPAQILKLDMRFIENTEDSNRGGNVLESVVRMAKWLNMAVIAEGVETLEQADYLKTIGCSYVQGYLYSRPVPLEEYEALLKSCGKEKKLLAVETVKNLDNNAFWDPKSMDTLIFNSYVGSACIMEYHDGSAELLRVSDMFMQALGSSSLTAEEALKLDWKHIFSEESRDALMDAVQRSIATGENISGEYEFINVPGCPEKLHFRITLRVIASAGSRYLIYCLNENITAQKEAEEKERASTEQLQAIMENITAGVYVAMVREGVPKVLFANEHFYEQRGYTREQYERVAEDAIMLVHEDEKERVHKTFKEADGPFTIAYRLRRPDGETRWMHSNVTLVKLPGYDGPVHLSVTNDITELREAEEKEHELNDRLQAILDAVNCGVFGVILSGDEMRYDFANDMYYSMLGYTREQFEAEVKNGLDLVHPDDRERIDAELSELIETGGSAIFEYRVIKRGGETAHLRVNASMLSLDESGPPISLGISNDVTDLVRARQQMGFLNDTAGKLLAQSEVEDAIDGLLRDILNYFKGDRVYVIENDDSREIAVNTYEVCAPGVASEMANLQSITYDSAAFWFRAFDKSRLIYIPDVDTLDESRAEEREMLQMQGVRSLVAVPLMRDGRQIGFAGVDDPREQLSDAEQLRALGDYIVTLLTRRDLNAKIANDREMLRAMMDDIPGGFARLRVLPDGNLTTEYVNEILCRMRGLTRERLLAEDVDDVLHTVHPDDWELVKSTVDEMIATGKPGNIKYRLRHADGSYTAYSVFGRVSAGEDGTKFINVYYADLSEREKKEMTIRETIPFVLSAILASSTLLAFAKDTDFRYLCASAEFIKTTPFTDAEEIIGKTDYEIFPKEIADILRGNDMKLLESDRSLPDYVQALPRADGSLRSFKLSKHILRDAYGNKLGIYGIGRDITEEKNVYSRLELLLDSIPGGVASYIASPGGIRLAYCNDAYCNIFGYTHEEYVKIASENIVSLAFDEDLPKLMEQVQNLIRHGKPIDFTYRAHTKNGGYKWVNMQGNVAERHGDICVMNGVLYDVTARVEAEHALRMSEEELRIAASVDGRAVARYDVKTGVYTHTSQFLLDSGFEHRIENVPRAFVDAGIIALECIDEYLAFYDRVKRGDSPCSVDVSVRGPDGVWRWERVNATVLRDADGSPSRAVIVFSDITELREKEAIYRKWEQSLRQRPEETYMLFRCNLSSNSSFDTAEGKLLWLSFAPGVHSFNERTQEYASSCVCEENRAEYIAFMNSDSLLANFYRGVHTKALEYQERLPDGTFRWLRLTVEMVEYPGSTDVEVFLLFEDIDEAKRDELHTRELAQTDPLTGVLNRTAFAQTVKRFISSQSRAENAAILMMDIDAFKNINDSLGHAMGDKVLTDTADTLRAVLRHDDLLGRLGGDEFVVCLRGVYGEADIGKKAAQICSLLHRQLTPELQTSVSIGVAVSPRDGRDFETLYRKADLALYKVKATGKNNYAFYDDSMAEEQAP